MWGDTRHLPWTVVAAMLAEPASAGQDAIALGGPPASGHSTRDRLTLTSDVASTRGGAADGAGGRMKGSVTPRGGGRSRGRGGDARLPDLRADHLRGRARGGEALARLADPTIGVWLAEQGQITHIAARRGVAAPAGPLTALLPQRFDSLPRRDMRIGESVELPFAMPSFLPALGDGPLSVVGELRLTLVKVASEGRERVATLRERMEGRSTPRMARLDCGSG